MERGTRIRLLKDFTPPLALAPIKAGTEGVFLTLDKSEWEDIEDYASVRFDGRSVIHYLPISYIGVE